MNPAAADLERAVNIWRRLPGPHPYMALGLGNLGRIRTLTGDSRAAEPLLKEAIEIAEAALGDSHPTTGSLYAAWADALRRLKRKPEAAAAQARSRRILADNPPDAWLSHRVGIRALAGKAR
jgi:hypothetical protein